MFYVEIILLTKKKFFANKVKNIDDWDKKKDVSEKNSVLR
jgi:hypothetical protein